MFCNNCGAQIDEGKAYCDVCGTPTGMTGTAPAASSGNFLDKVAGKVHMTKKTLLTVCGAAVAAIVVLILLISLLSGSKTTPIKHYFAAIQKAKVTQMEKCYPKDVWEELTDYMDEDDYQDSLEAQKDDLEEEFGSNLKITYKVTSSSKYDADDLKSLAKSLDSSYDLDKDKVTAAYKLKLDVKYKGSEDDETVKMAAVVYKYKGKWYLSSIYER